MQTNNGQSVIKGRPEPRKEKIVGKVITLSGDVRESYTKHIKTVVRCLHPELEVITEGQAFDMSLVRLYLLTYQEYGFIVGHRLYEHLKLLRKIEISLGLSHGEALVRNPVAYPVEWRTKRIFLWRTVLEQKDGELVVPFLIWAGNRVEIKWRWLNSLWGGDDLAATAPMVLI